MTADREPEPFIRRVRIRNFRSIADCDVTLGSLTVLVGFNASGKTNFLDALRFVADALVQSPAQAVEDRGGMEALLHRGAAGTADSFEIWLELASWPSRQGIPIHARYGFEIGRDPTGEAPLLVLREAWEIEPLKDLKDEGSRPPATPTPQPRLRLPAMAVDSSSALVLETELTSMCFYDLNTGALAALEERRQSPPGMRWLGRSGEHLGRVLEDIESGDPAARERFDAYLSALVPGALGVDQRREGRYSTVQARFRARNSSGLDNDGSVRPDDGSGVEVFQREELSEGTLRAAGVLAALSQIPVLRGTITLVGIEEPETALHPAGVSALYEALDDASQHTQVIVTSQSSDLLDSEYAKPEHIRVVANADGATRIGEIDASGKAILDKGLMTLAELHRSGQMRPELGSRDQEQGDNQRQGRDPGGIG